MPKQPLRLISYLLISLVVGIMVTLVMDSFENIAVEKRIRKELEQEIRTAGTSFKNNARSPALKEVTNFAVEFSNSAMRSKVVVIDPAYDKKPDNQKLDFLFTYEVGDEKLDFYILKSYLDNELAILEIPELFSGIFITIVLFTSIVLYFDRKNQAVIINQQFEKKDAEFKKILEEHEALALLGRMVATLAHELKTPIATISNLIQVLPLRLGDEKFTSRFITLTTEELSRIRQLIDNLLVYGKDLEVGNEEWIHLSPFIKKIAFSNSIQVEIPDFIEIYGDKFLLHILFDNLMRNSKNEGADKIKIQIRTKKSADQHAELLLEDNGNGFPVNGDINFLLDPFITNHSSGSGLGLYLVKKIATAHDGNVSLYAMEHGAGVNINLPQKRVMIHEQK